MHVLFLHQNYPAQFGQIARYLIQRHGYQCTFVSNRQVVDDGAGIQHVYYRPRGGASPTTHYCSRSFENAIWHSHAAYDALLDRPDIQPDLIVAHSGFTSSLFLRELYPRAPQINYFEFFYHSTNSDVDFRTDLPSPQPIDLLRLRARNANILLDASNCDAGYAPTEFQRAQIPVEYQAKISTIFDGIDTQFWQRQSAPKRQVAGIEIPEGMKVITYVSRGFEAIRGSDIFLQAADRICRERNDVMVLIAGEDRVAYGGDSRFTGELTFRQWCIQRYRPDLSRIHFVGRLPPSELVGLLSLSDLHIYLTVPFVVSWSLLNALSCGTVVLASDTPPVREMIRNGVNGWLVNFFDVDGFVQKGLDILDKPTAQESIRQKAVQLIHNRYALDICLPQMLQLYSSVLNQRP